MSDSKRILVYYEGDDDGAILERLQRADLLPDNLKLIERVKSKGGKDVMVRELATHVSPRIGGLAIALRDYDDLEANQVGDWFSATLKSQLKEHKPGADIKERATDNPRVSLLEISDERHTGCLAGVCAGLPGERQLVAKWNLQQFSMDDYVLRLVCNQGIYEAVSELRDVTYELAMSKVAKTQKLLMENGISVIQAKRLLHLLRGITGFRASPAIFASRLMEEGSRAVGEEEFAKLFKPLIDDIRTAEAALIAR